MPSTRERENLENNSYKVRVLPCTILLDAFYTPYKTETNTTEFIILFVGRQTAAHRVVTWHFN